MKKFLYTFILLAVTSTALAANITLTVKNTRYQKVTGFGAACCDGAMEPHGSDTKPVDLLYGEQSPIGLNILRMEISPNFVGNDPDGWATNYDWNGSLPSAKLAKLRGAIVFGTPWSPPGKYKTNGSAVGGNKESQGNVRATLKDDCYELFFPWLNTFLKWMKNHGVLMDAVSIQNEPDWWVNYSGCLYTPEQQLKLVKNYANLLDREKYPGVRLISAEPFAYEPNYCKLLMNDAVAREQIDIVGGHIYGSAPMANMKTSAEMAVKYGKEVWMTENSVSDKVESLPNWDEQLKFADVLNECMVAGCTGYIYWYMRAYWSFVGTGETKYNPGNTRNTLLPRAYVMSHFSKYVTGSTRLDTNPTLKAGEEQKNMEYSAYIKGDSIIVMCINKFDKEYDMKIKLPYMVKSGVHVLSTGNEKANLCQKSDITIDVPSDAVLVHIPKKSLNTYVLIMDAGATAISQQVQRWNGAPTVYYDLHGHRLSTPRGLCVERQADGSTRVVYMNN